MTTTKRAAPGPTAHDLRYYVTTLLALVYASVWWTFGLDASQPHIAEERERAADGPVASSRTAVWYQDLPPARRPVVHLPPHLQIHVASATEAATRVDAPARPVRVSMRRAGRVRTRSS